MKTQLQKLKPILIIFVNLLVILIFLKYLLKISYSNFSGACYYILLMTSCLSFIALMYLRKELVYNLLTISSFALTNMLFVHCLHISSWDMQLLNEVKWTIILSELPFAILLFAKKWHKQENKKDLQLV